MSNSNPIKPWLTTGEAARELGITMESVLRLIRSGKFEVKKEPLNGSKTNFRYLISNTSIAERIKYLELVKEGR